MDNVTRVLLSITGVALAATIVVNGVNSAKVAGALGNAFSGSLSAPGEGLSP